MKRICVYCGASPGLSPDYVAAAKVLGGVLAAKGIGLAYGGASIGVMGALADAVTANGGEAIGGRPRDLLKKETPHSSLASLEVVDSMHERKALMVKLSDGFMALPGGLGTLEELFEVWTWAQLGFHRKPCALLNVRSYFEPLITFLDSAVEEGFITENHRSMLMVGNDPTELISLLESYQPPEVPKWLRQDGL